MNDKLSSTLNHFWKVWKIDLYRARLDAIEGGSLDQREKETKGLYTVPYMLPFHQAQTSDCPVLQKLIIPPNIIAASI